MTKPKSEGPPANKLVRRRNQDGTFSYWSRLGWSPVYGMPLDEKEAEFRKNEALRTWKDVEIVPNFKIAAPKRLEPCKA